MELKYIISFLIFSFLVVILDTYNIKANGPLAGKKIVIDAGHGGVDPGSIYGKVYEKDINLKISKMLKGKLETKGAKVIMIRDGDYDLGTPKAFFRKKSDFDHRILIINQSQADYYVSIHLNYLVDQKYWGPQVFYSNVLKENQEIANKIQTYLNENLGSDREVKKIANTIYMYSKLKVKGVLVECGFLSNKAEREKLLNEDYLDTFASLLAESFLQV